MWTNFEKFFYESRPYFYSILGVFAIGHHQSKLLLVCGLTLIACSVLVFRMRLAYRYSFSNNFKIPNNKTMKVNNSVTNVYRI